MRQSLIALLAGTALVAVMPALAQKSYSPGASDTEIKLGQTVAYSGPGSAYSMVGRMWVACFKMLNETKGGINGRKLNLLSEDDAYSASAARSSPSRRSTAWARTPGAATTALQSTA